MLQFLIGASVCGFWELGGLSVFGVTWVKHNPRFMCQHITNWHDDDDDDIFKPCFYSISLGDQRWYFDILGTLGVGFNLVIYLVVKAI